MILISGMGLFLAHSDMGRDAERQVLAAIADYASPAVRESVRAVLEQVQDRAVLGGPIGTVALLFTAAALFMHFERAFDRIWRVPEPEKVGLLRALRNLLFVRLRAFLMLLAIGMLLLITFAIGLVSTALKFLTAELVPWTPWAWWIADTGASVLLNTGVFTLLYKLMPKVTIRWFEALRGAILAAVLWECARLILGSFVVGEKYSAYGVVGSFIALMLWIYVGASIVFLGAVYVRQICERCDPRAAPSENG
jgi:membrane protein